MKKVLLLLIVSYETISFAGNLCVGHVGRRFRKHAPIVLNSHEDERVACNCNCSAHPRSQHGHGYKCLKCGHRLLPHNVEKSEPIIFKPESTEYINAWKQNRHHHFDEYSFEKFIEYEILEIEKLRKNLL